MASLSHSTFSIATQITSKFVEEHKISHQIETDDHNLRIVCHMGKSNLIVFKMERSGTYEITNFIGKQNPFSDEVVYEKKSDYVFMGMISAITCFFEQILISDLSTYMSKVKDRVYLNSL